MHKFNWSLLSIAHCCFTPIRRLGIKGKVEKFTVRAQHFGSIFKFLTSYLGWIDPKVASRAFKSCMRISFWWTSLRCLDMFYVEFSCNRCWFSGQILWGGGDWRQLLHNLIRFSFQPDLVQKQMGTLANTKKYLSTIPHFPVSASPPILSCELEVNGEKVQIIQILWRLWRQIG